MYHIIRIISIILFATAIGCNEQTTNVDPASSDKDYGTYDISSYMPLSIGNRWIYEFSTPAERAILDRRIKDTVRLSDNLLMYGYSEDVLVFTQPTDLPIVGYIGHRGGAIYFASVQGNVIGSKVPVLASPILNGHLWYADIDGRRDSFQIVSVYQGEFENSPNDTLVVVRRWNQYIIDSIWFGRSIGLVSQSVLSADNLTKRQLLSFSLNY